jgi:hypothetical protein
MKKLKKTFIVFIALIFFISCDNKDANDCFQKAGTIITEEVTVDNFTEIIVNERIELFIKESNVQKVLIETGENLLTDIELTVKNSQLEIKNYNECNFVRDFGITKVYIYSPNITEIRNSSSLPVHSVGLLNYPELALISENYLSDYLNSGDFNLEINNNKLSLVANGPSNHTITGSTNYLNINLAGSNPRFDGKNLVAKDAYLFARSTNDILIKVTNEVNGNLFNTGDVILYKKPNIINLNTYYTGKVIHNY